MSEMEKPDARELGAASIKLVWQVHDALMRGLAQYADTEHRAVQERVENLRKRIAAMFNKDSNPADPELMNAISDLALEMNCEIDFSLRARAARGEVG